MIIAEKATKNPLFGFLAKKVKIIDFFLDIYYKNKIILDCKPPNFADFHGCLNETPWRWQAVPHKDPAILNRQEGLNSIADTFGVCNWRPDSETVASRAFAQALK